MSEHREHKAPVYTGDSNSLAPVGWLYENGWNSLAEFLEVVGPLAAALLAVPFGLWVGIAGGMCVDFVKVNALRRGCDRYNKTLQLLPFQISEFKERFCEFAADIQVEIHELGRKCLEEPYNRKYRYFVEFLLGRMSEDQALTKDKYYRYHRWVEQLDLVVLVCLSKFDKSQANSSLPRNEHLVRSWFKVDRVARRRPNITNLDYLSNLVIEEAATEWDLIPQFAANGILYFDRGGGAATPGEQATLLWHHDIADFAEYLRKSDERQIWKTTEQDEGD